MTYQRNGAFVSLLAAAALASVFSSSAVGAQTPPAVAQTDLAGAQTGSPGAQTDSAGAQTDSAGAQTDSAGAQTETDQEVGMALPGADADPSSDHERVVGKFAIAYLGTAELLVGRWPAETEAAPSPESVSVALIGTRYWFMPRVAAELGLGVLIESRDSEQVSIEGNTTRMDTGGNRALLVHAGVPLALAYSGHFALLLVPDLNLGFVGQDLDSTPGGPELSNSGFHLDAGLRAGAEIHFGFIDVPQLSLQATAGLRYAIDQTKSTLETTPEQSIEVQRSALYTTLDGTPWEVLEGSISAFYYF